MIKLFLNLILHLSIAACLGGCACTGGYLPNRGHDAADVFTATLGYGVGVKARVGPLQAGLMTEVTGFGLRAGDLLGISDFWPTGYDTPASWEATATICNLEVCRGGKTAKQRGKAFSYSTDAPIVYPQSPYEARPHETDDAVVRRVKRLEEEEYVHAPAPFFTEIEVVAALGPSIRLGFNPGELLDFILGWTTLDIYNDDLEKRKKIEQPDAEVQSEGAPSD